MKLVGDVTISQEQISKVVADIQAKKCSKGAGIRELFAGGLEVKEISVLTGIRYNHVYNVVKNEVIVNDLEVETSGRSSENSKKAQIVRMLEEGKTINEISKELKCLYNYVWQVAKAAGYTSKKDADEETIKVTLPDGLVPHEFPAEVVKKTEEQLEKIKKGKKAHTA